MVTLEGEGAKLTYPLPWPQSHPKKGMTWREAAGNRGQERARAANPVERSRARPSAVAPFKGVGKGGGEEEAACEQ